MGYNATPPMRHAGPLAATTLPLFQAIINAHAFVPLLYVRGTKCIVVPAVGAARSSFGVCCSLFLPHFPSPLSTYMYIYIRSSGRFIPGPGQILGARLATHNARRLTLRPAVRRLSRLFIARALLPFPRTCWELTA